MFQSIKRHLPTATDLRYAVEGAAIVLCVVALDARGVVALVLGVMIGADRLLHYVAATFAEALAAAL